MHDPHAQHTKAHKERDTHYVRRLNELKMLTNAPDTHIHVFLEVSFSHMFSLGSVKLKFEGYIFHQGTQLYIIHSTNMPSLLQNLRGNLQAFHSYTNRAEFHRDTTEISFHSRAKQPFFLQHRLF